MGAKWGNTEMANLTSKFQVAQPSRDNFREIICKEVLAKFMFEVDRQRDRDYGVGTWAKNSR